MFLPRVHPLKLWILAGRIIHLLLNMGSVIMFLYVCKVWGTSNCNGCNKRGFDLEALASNMLKDFSLKPDKFTLASILSACANLEKFGT
ncbi:hypothetical protein TorRG33x02_354770 [Trema orientale]|uniref:Pentatricopeptide repeat n=1 Tax=Trema orientale TaxID=63057 RepID=A0A2P5AAG4_TREOI|nr:hypothetical protein TorRG33x02_354770 [Trema orientale]